MFPVWGEKYCIFQLKKIGYDRELVKYCLQFNKKKIGVLGSYLALKNCSEQGNIVEFKLHVVLKRKFLLMHLLSLDYFCHHQGLFTSDLTNIFCPMQLPMWQGEINLCWHNIFLRLLWSFCDKIHLKTWMASKWEFFDELSRMNCILMSGCTNP